MFPSMGFPMKICLPSSLEILGSWAFRLSALLQRVWIVLHWNWYHYRIFPMPIQIVVRKNPRQLSHGRHLWSAMYDYLKYPLIVVCLCFSLVLPKLLLLRSQVYDFSKITQIWFPNKFLSVVWNVDRINDIIISNWNISIFH